MIYKSHLNQQLFRDNAKSDGSSSHKQEWVSTKLNQIESIKQQINSVIDITNDLEQRRVYSKDNAQRRIEDKKKSFTEKMMEPIILKS